jgi:hypothetical protein
LVWVKLRIISFHLLERSISATVCGESLLLLKAFHYPLPFLEESTEWDRGEREGRTNSLFEIRHSDTATGFPNVPFVHSNCLSGSSKCFIYLKDMSQSTCK